MKKNQAGIRAPRLARLSGNPRARKLAALAMAATFPTLASAINIDAGDYTALPAGANIGALYYQHAEDTRIYANGSRVAGGNITQDIGIARFIHFMSVGGFTIDPQVLIPFGHVGGTNQMSALGNNTGLGDAIFAATVWVVNRPESNTFLGITPFIYAPTGSYDRNRGINLGENRWKFALQAGFITPVAPKVILDLAADATAFTPNHNFGATGATMTESPLFQAQGWLRYQLTSSVDLRVGGSYVFGGNQTIAGVSQANRQSTPSFLVGAAWFPTKTWQIIALYGRQTSTENGPLETQRFNVRVAHFF
ncbi:phenol degradation protein [Burkholderia lata]|uniref:transporter n=1 Tax=Burkholderia lata (strain ATCC 17760 / DSM 23089 / LMG 22485 / NCIMB 9086 / R18194 / 383) TaxID=482957 RepID=UPI0014532428|nr:transporter [Burkholderia lata]VWC96332.1 phenol degradation protein [Burkholderia lata]